MKKKYKKPTIIIEDFKTDSAFALGCEVKYTLGNECGSENPTINSAMKVDGVFMADGSCTEPAFVNSDGSTIYDGICYHGPSDNNLLNS